MYNNGIKKVVDSKIRNIYNARIDRRSVQGTKLLYTRCGGRIMGGNYVYQNHQK